MKLRDSGFILIGLVGVLPVVIAAILSISSLGLYLKTKSQVLHTCRKGLLEIQNDMASALKELLSLNPQARNLRLQEKEIQIKIAAASVTCPPCLPALRAELAANRVQQTILRTKQLAIVNGANLKALYQMNALKTRLKANIRHSVDPRLAVKRSQPLAIASDYEPVPNFERRQAGHLEWEINQDQYLSALFPSERLFPKLKGGCSATISKNGRNQWVEKLGTAKF